MSVDVDYASRTTDKRSVSGGALIMVKARLLLGCLGRSDVRPCRPLSEVVFVFMGECVEEARLCGGGVLSFLAPEFDMACINVFEDNQGGFNQSAENPLRSSKSKTR